MKRWTLWAAVGLMLVAFGLLAYNAQAQSPTMDEQNHIARGYVFLRTGDPRLSIEHPPFINSLEALPLLLLPDVRIPTDDWSWQVGEWYQFSDLFLWQVNHNVDRMVYLARLPVIALTLLLASLAARWAGELWGRSSALVALPLVTLDPNILAHGSLATTDMGQTAAVFVAGYAVWRTVLLTECRDVALQRFYTVRKVGLTGLALGAMLASKISALAFVGVFGALFVIDALTHHTARWASVMRRLAAMAVMVIIAFVVLWGVYAFQVAPAIENGTSVPLGTYWKGVLSIFEQTQGGRPSYLLGKTSVHGWWTYFPIAFALKTPLPTLGLLLLAIPASVTLRRWRANIFLLLPVLAYWALLVQSALNIGYRHLLPTLPFLYVWAAQLGVGCWMLDVGSWKLEVGSWMLDVGCWMLDARGGIRRLSLIILCVWLALDAAWIAPHFLSYFNPVGGGPENGWKILADSNIDWGQDLKYLRDYVRDNQLGKIKLSWFGSSYPELYGIEYEPLPGLPHHFDLWASPPFNVQQPEPGVYVISVSNLVEIPFEDKWVFAYFRERQPDARIGYSIYVYRVTR
jgi:hypothetical protein